MKKIILTLIASSAMANATITLSDGIVANLADENSTELTTATSYAVLVALNNDLFDGLVFNDTISVGETVGDGKYFVLKVGLTQAAGALGQAQQASVNFDIAGTALDNDAASGRNLAFIWFPGLITTDVTLNKDDVYGAANFFDADLVDPDTTRDWVLPADGGSRNLENITGTPLRAEFVVVPEPSSTALLGLGAFGLIARRRRA